MGVAALAVLCLLALTPDVSSQKPIEVLKIGTGGALTSGTTKQKDDAAMETLRDFIKDETGLKNEIVKLKDWREVLEKMTRGEYHVGVFQGPEFAWAKEKSPELQPMALAVNVYRYPTVHVVTKQDSPVKDFAGLQGKSVAISSSAPRFLRMFVELQAKPSGKAPEQFFSKTTTPDNFEDALDDAVDGNVDAAVADRAALEAFKRRKPARFRQLKEVVHSEPFPPVVIAHYNKVIDLATLTRFSMGLLNAHKKERGETVLTLFRITNFEAPPADFDQVLAATRKLYPPSDAGNGK